MADEAIATGPRPRRADRRRRRRDADGRARAQPAPRADRVRAAQSAQSAQASSPMPSSKSSPPRSASAASSSRSWCARRAARRHLRDHRRRAALARGAARRPARRADRRARRERRRSARARDHRERPAQPISIRWKRRAAIRRSRAEFNHTQDDIAKIVGKSRSHVANTLRLLQLPETVKAYINAGKLSAGHARALVGQPIRKRWRARSSSKGLNVRQVEALAQEQRRRRPARRRDARAARRTPTRWRWRSGCRRARPRGQDRSSRQGRRAARALPRRSISSTRL